MITINSAARLRASTLVKADWFDTLSEAGKAAYLDHHPYSSRAGGGKGGAKAAKENTHNKYAEYQKLASDNAKNYAKHSDADRVSKEAENRIAKDVHKEAQYSESEENNLAKSKGGKYKLIK